MECRSEESEVFLGTSEEPKKDPFMRTDDCARRLEYVTHSKWTTKEYSDVCSILRLYRHQSILSILDRVAGKTNDLSGGEAMKGE